MFRCVTTTTMIVSMSLGCSQKPQITSTGGGGKGGSDSDEKPGGSGGSSSSSSSGGTGAAGAPGGGFTFQPADAGAVVVGSGGGGGDEPKTCGLQKFTLERRPGELMLVLDRSGSMKDRPRGALTTKWADATAALDEVIMKTEGAILWGLKMFPSTNVTCEINDMIEVPAALNNFMPVTGSYKTAGPNGDGTPTTQAIRKTVAYLQSKPSTNTRYLVLATDGEPTCMDGIDGDLRDDLAAVQAVSDAAAAGFHTFVLGIATGVGAATVLNDMAVAGLEPRNADPKYYPAANRQDLVTALEVIAGKVSDCTFGLSTPPPVPENVAVKVDGTKIDHDPAKQSGWEYTADMKAIQVFGAVCDQLKAGTAKNIDITYGCKDIIIQ